MPLILPPHTRRQWLAGAAAAGTALFSRWSFAAEAERPSRVVLLADTHIAGDRKLEARGVVMAENLSRVVSQLTALDERPDLVVINGDCAYLTGQTGDYTVLVELLEPLRAAEIPVYLALGNHDHREHCRAALAARDDSLIEGRHIALVEFPDADWFILDSLDKVNSTPGELGEAQLAWLAKMLDSRPEKPALVVLHHNPDERAGISGLKDTRKLLDVLEQRKRVKAWFFGHTHNWDVAEQNGLHFINQPPVAYVFREGRPNGRLDVSLAEGELRLKLHCLSEEHPQHGETHALKLRA